MEIRLQELRSNAVTRGRDWLRGALAEISVMELRKMAGARNVGRGPDKKWLAVVELRARIAGSLGTLNAGRVRRKRVMRKVAGVFHGSMLSDECCFVVAVCCMLLACRKLRLANWKNFAQELFHKVLSGSVVLCRQIFRDELRALAVAAGVETRAG